MEAIPNYMMAGMYAGFTINELGDRKTLIKKRHFTANFRSIKRNGENSSYLVVIYVMPPGIPGPRTWLLFPPVSRFWYHTRPSFLNHLSDDLGCPEPSEDHGLILAWYCDCHDLSSSLRSLLTCFRREQGQLWLVGPGTMPVRLHHKSYLPW